MQPSSSAAGRALRKRRPSVRLAILACLALLLIVQLNMGPDSFLGGSGGSKQGAVPRARTLYPGELAGYTGWARPATTLAGSFSMVQPCSTSTQSGTEWTCTVQCFHVDCQAGGDLFYVRAYGPAILPGRVKDYGNGVYEVSIHAFDPGLYTVEVVLTFSNPPAFSEFPMERFTEPGYEGFMLPDFPLFLSVSGMVEISATPLARLSLPWCNASQLLESSPGSAVETGRWVVQDKVTEHAFQRVWGEISLEG